MRSNINIIGDYDFIILTETWLNDSINDSELGFNYYYIIRCDRSLFSSNKNDGGGVLIAINKKFKFVIIPPFDNSFELLLIKVFIDNVFIVLGVCYLSPDLTSEHYVNFVSNLQASLSDIFSESSGCKFLLLGDFNIPGYIWLNNGHYSQANGFHKDVNIRDAARLLSSWCKLYNLCQLNEV